MTFLARFEAPAYAALRMASGFMFFFHGTQKILGWLATKAPPAIGSQLWVGGLIELFCGLLIAIGLFTRYAAFLASGTMAVAYVQFHWKLNSAAFNWLPLVNKGELALLYCFAFLLIATRGPGIVALDRRFSRR
jgi:putative oxidoreductase